MKTLILGHGRDYTDSRCSPININEWINREFTCVDEMESVNPDIVFKLGSYKWTFAEDESYDRIIDCTGGIFRMMNHQACKQKLYSDEIMKEINRILRPNGIFYGDIRCKIVHHKPI